MYNEGILDWSDQELRAIGCEDKEEVEDAWGLTQEGECSEVVNEEEGGTRELISVYDCANEELTV